MMQQKAACNSLSRQWKQRVHRPGQNTASNPPPGSSRQYRPPLPASRNEQAPMARNPQGRPEQCLLNGSGGETSSRRNPNTYGLRKGSSSSTASPQFPDSRPLPAGISRCRASSQLGRLLSTTWAQNPPDQLPLGATTQAIIQDGTLIPALSPRVLLVRQETGRGMWTIIVKMTLRATGAMRTTTMRMARMI